MLLPSLLLPAVAAAAAPSPPQLFSNSASAAHRIPSVHESTVQARRILQLQGIATLSTVFPSSDSASESTALNSGASILESRPNSVSAAPIGLMEYYAACGSEPYNPTVLGVTIATTMKNAAAGSNVTLSARYVLPANAPQPPPDPWAYLPANLPRFALVGYLEKLAEEEVKRENVTGCFFERHPEARIWAPGADIHDSWWGRLVVEEVYFFGGFGDRARIGWLPIEEWKGIKQSEVDGYRLVGEEGYESGQRWRNGEETVLGEEL